MSNTQLKVALYTDCVNLVHEIQSENSADVPSWQARETVGECVRWMQQATGRINFTHITREGLIIPHNLANSARRT